MTFWGETAEDRRRSAGLTLVFVTVLPFIAMAELLVAVGWPCRVAR